MSNKERRAEEIGFHKNVWNLKSGGFKLLSNKTKLSETEACPAQFYKKLTMSDKKVISTQQ